MTIDGVKTFFFLLSLGCDVDELVKVEGCEGDNGGEGVEDGCDMTNGVCFLWKRSVCFHPKTVKGCLWVVF